MPSPHTRAGRLPLFPSKKISLFLLLFLPCPPAHAAPVDSEIPSPEVQVAQQDSSNGRFAAAKEKLAAILASTTARPEDRE